MHGVRWRLNFILLFVEVRLSPHLLKRLLPPPLDFAIFSQNPTAHKFSDSESSFRRAEPEGPVLRVLGTEPHVQKARCSTPSPGLSTVRSRNPCRTALRLSTAASDTLRHVALCSCEGPAGSSFQCCPSIWDSVSDSARRLRFYFV